MPQVSLTIQEMEYQEADRCLTLMGTNEFNEIVTVRVRSAYPMQLARDLEFITHAPFRISYVEP